MGLYFKSTQPTVLGFAALPFPWHQFCEQDSCVPCTQVTGVENRKGKIDSLMAFDFLCGSVESDLMLKS